MSQIEAVFQVLGGSTVVGPAPESLHQIQERLEEGLPYAALEALTERLELSQGEVLSSLALTARTLARRKKEHRLHAVESDRLYRVARITARAFDVFGDEEKARRWLHKPNRSLGGKVPLELLTTDVGAQHVDDILGRIEHGIPS
ncbi:MAG: DUF2384 domain-containing protein [Deltaproteobacteria bacterium]|nr:DUF2384 domain-containing protein [Deltaproteobacteria bacterium]